MDSRSPTRRRADRAAEVRRRRLGGLFALGLLAAVAVAVAVIVLGTGTRSTSRASAAAPARHRSPTAADGRRRRTPPRTTRIGPPTGHPGGARAAVLMYHVVAPPPAGAPYPGLYVPAGEFAGQMHALAAAGYHAITLDELRANWLHGDRLPAKPIVITFDNGYRSQFTHALPVLRRLGWPAVENIQLAGLPPSQGGLTSDQVRGLLGAGWELDTQGISHADLPDLSAGELRFQVVHARTLLRARYHQPVNWFCYPSGQYDATVVAAVRAAGFVGSTTVVPGWASRGDSPYALPRLRVLGGTSPAALLSQVATAAGDGPTPPADLSSSS